MNDSGLTGRSARPRAAAGALLVSVHTRWAELILSGVKRVELRRRFDLRSTGSRLMIYATAPTAAVVGHALIGGVERLPPGELWERFGAASAVPRTCFDEYFEGRPEGCAVLLSRPFRFAAPILLSELRSAHRLHPPQSYLFLGEAHRELIDHEYA